MVEDERWSVPLSYCYLALNDGGHDSPVVAEENGESRKVITLFGGFSRMEQPQYRGLDSIQKGKRIMDHIANIREVRAY